LFLNDNPNYLNETSYNNQVSEINAIVGKICNDENYRSQHLSSLLVTALINVKNHAQTGCTNFNSLFYLSWDELGQCLVMGIGSYIAQNYSAIKTAWNLLNGSGITFSNVRAVLELLFPELKASVAIITTVACIVKEWIW
jgi:hypothetical protein